MSDYKALHTDVLLIILDDLHKRYAGGELSPSEFANEVAPVSTEMRRRLLVVQESQEKELDKIRRTIDEVNRTQAETIASAKEMHEFNRQYVQQMEQMIDDYEAFLQSKQLDDECEDYFWDRLRERNLAGDKVASKRVIKDDPAERFSLFLQGILPRTVALYAYKHMAKWLSPETLKDLDDDLFNELVADGKI